jgi:Legume lectin domain/Bacterial Ig-like domain (group 3)/FG-GAP-like repeat
MRLRRLVVLAFFVVSALSFASFAVPAVANGQAATSTTLQVTPACLQSGCVTTLTATVTSGGTPVHPGLVVFCDKGPADCQNEAPIGRAQLTSNGTAIIRLGLSAGPHTLRAIFHGTKTLSSSTSSTQNLADTPIAANFPTALNAPVANPVNGGFTFTSYLNTFGPTPPTGTVSLVDTSRDNAAIASGPVVPGTSTFSYTVATPNSFSQIPISVINAGVAFATGDFNNDGFQDIAELASNTNLLVFLGDGNGNFKQGPVYNSHTGAQGNLLVGDFNSDGKLDVAIQDSGSSKIFVSLGNGNGTFTPAAPSTINNSSQYLYVGDFNNDGIPDLFTANTRASAGSTAQVLLGVGDGTFTAQTPLNFPGETFGGAAVGDFNGDGVQDVALAYYPIPAGESTVATETSLYRGNGDGTFEATPVASFSGQTGVLVAGDFDGDGVTDLLTPVTLYYGLGNFSFVAKATGGGGGVEYGIAGDYTGSGNLEVAYIGLDVSVYDGKGGNGLSRIGEGGPYDNNYFEGGFAADFNGDGLPDFVFPTSLQTPTLAEALVSWQSTSTSTEAALDPGIHNLIANYSGDASHNSSSSVLTPIRSSGIEYSGGFAGGAGLVFTGSAALHGNTIQLTDGGQQEAGAFFSKQRIDVSGIVQTDFDFQLTSASGDGFAYVLQSNGPNAIGSSGAGLGYGNPPGVSGPSITNSLAVAFDLHNNQGEGNNSVRLERDGVTSPAGAIDLTPMGLDLHSGHPFHAEIFSNGSNVIQVILTDLQTNHRVPLMFGSYNTPDTSINGELLHGSMAYAGFTGSTGASTAVQVISNWTINLDNPREDPPGPPYPKPSYPSGFLGSTGLAFNGIAAVSGPSLQLTNGTPFKATSAFAIAKVLPQGFFTTDFDFQIANGVGDGFAFVLQNDRLASLGTQGGGLGYGPDRPGASEPSIPNSLAIKFDTHNNAGESPNSTGLYLNGASPTTPSIDLSPYRINLQSGHTFHARIESNGTQLTLSITDLDQYANFTTVLASGSTVESIIPQQAFAGFTAGTGATSSSIKILNWTWAID